MRVLTIRPAVPVLFLTALLWSGPAWAQATGEVTTETETEEVEVDVDEGEVDVEEEGAEVETGAVRREATMEAESPNWMGTLLGSTLGGAAVGAIIGGAVWVLDKSGDEGEDFDWSYVGYGAAAGAVGGLAVGVIRVAVAESRVSAAAANGLVPDLSPPVGLTYTLRF